MGIIKVKPTSPGRRNATYLDNSDITKKEPEKSLVKGLRKKRRKKQSGKDNNSIQRRWSKKII